MDDTVYKIAIAGFLHDIGKFAERADMPVSKEYMENNSGLYQPYYNNRYTHKHALYTAAFIEKYEKDLPIQFNKAVWGLGDPFINLTAMHHKPETPLQWIIAIADRVSSGFDRKEFEEYNQELLAKDYLKTRLLPILEEVSLNEKWKDNMNSFNYSYPLRELSPQNIFPVSEEEAKHLTDKEAKDEYKRLFEGFIKALAALWHRESIPLWFEHFENLFLIFGSSIPAATVGRVIPDVSLFDHSKMTSAFASAIYLYHKERGSLTEESIKDYSENKFLVVSGNFYGIQDFIFTGGGSTGRASAKLLRGRSFTVSLLTELAADMLCREIGIPSSSIVLNAAGRFTLIAPNTKETKGRIDKVSEMMNRWLIDNFYGESSIGIAYMEASCNDFVSNNFPAFWENLQRFIDEKKYKKFDIGDHAGVFKDYLDSFNNTLNHPLCPFCGKRPSYREAGVKISRDMEENACKICRDQIYIGEHLVKEDKIAIGTTDVDFKGDSLLEPLFGFYQVSFDVDGKLNELAKAGKLLKYWNVGISKDGKLSKEITSKFINGYIPRYEDEDNYDDRLLAGKKKDETRLELIDSIKNKYPKTFLAIAKKALQFTDKPDKFKGIEALGVLKADIDNLGLIFSHGIKKELQTFSRLSTLSRQLNNFFTIYLPNILSTNEMYKDIYTVFAGGDDLFLIGPWNRTIEFSHILNKAFRRYVCENRDITISAGVTINKPNEPVMNIAESSEKALNQTKSSGKNGVTIFYETVRWDALDGLNEIKVTLENWLEGGLINNAMLYRINDLIQMAKKEREIQKTGYTVSIEDMECLKWRSMLKYTIVRNVGKKLKGNDKNSVIDEVMKVGKWLNDYAGGLKIPLWQVLYNIR
ncbi:MAG: type III-A CRISPR-associated protein Cas10/Csm1 [Syntrophorhabdaceae bacterium]|nr:type III-A CRISPR-associated protein Cas10/Csm1 [Syntrophorhabdaceae bacterium]